MLQHESEGQLSEPRSVYVHVPFCSHRCGYCNFTLVTGRDDLIEPYLRALELELETVLRYPRQIETLFIGGGTPSYLLPGDSQRLLNMLQRWFCLRSPAEFSCEINPIHCQQERLQVLRDHGINRLSLGGQSFSNRKLRVLERDHTAQQLQTACRISADLFSNVSLDLIFAAPDESLDEWQADVAIAIDSPIQHLSTYGLTIERGAAYYARHLHGQLAELDADLQLAMYEHAIETLTERGWEHYEVSNFARPGFRCRHNEAYWLGRTWWAFGPGAASFVPVDRHNLGRCVNHRSTTTYIKRLLSGQSPISEREIVTPGQQLRERLVFGLRRMEGVNLEQLAEGWGAPVRNLFEPHLSKYLEEGWLSLDDAQQLRLTRRGLVISDSLWPDLLAESPSSPSGARFSEP